MSEAVSGSMSGAVWESIESNRPPVVADSLVTVLSRAVLETPGVAELAPTLSTAGLRAMVDRRATDGITLITRGGTVEVDVNVATGGERSARAVAHAIRDRVRAELGAHGADVGSVTVSVLTIGSPPQVTEVSAPVLPTPPGP